MAGTYWLTILPETSKLKSGITAAMNGVKVTPEFGIDKDQARKAGRDAAKIVEDEVSKSGGKVKPKADQSASQKAGKDAAKAAGDELDKSAPKVKPKADQPSSQKAGSEAGRSVAEAFRSAASGERLGSELGSKLKSSLAILGPALGGLTVFQGLKSSLSEGMDFTTSLNVMGGVSKATAEQLKQVSDAARQLGSDASLPGVSATTAAQAMTELAKGGFSVQQSMDAARGTLQLAGAAGIDAASAATIQADALHTFGLSAKDAGYAADVLANVANASTGEITDFANGFQQAGAVASQFGLKIDDTAAALGTLANQGIKGSDAGTLIKSTLLALTDQGKPAQGAIKELGLTVYDAQGKFVGMRSLMDQLGQAAGRMTPEMYQAATNTLFGSDAARLAGVAAKEGAKGFDTLKDAVNQQGGAADMAAARTKGLPGAWANFQNTLDNVKLSIYDMIQGPLTGLLDGFSKLIGFVGDNKGAFAGIAAVISTVAVPALAMWVAGMVSATATSIAAGIGSMIGAWGRMAGALRLAVFWTRLFVVASLELAVAQLRAFGASIVSGIGSMVSAIRNLSIGTRLAAAAQWLLNAAMTANPIGLIVAAVVAVGVALWAFFTKTETGRKIWAVVWTNIKAVAAAVWDWMKGAVQAVGQVLTWLWQNVAVPAFNAIRTAIQIFWAAAQIVWEAFKSALQFVGDKLNWLWQNVAVPAFDGIKNAVSTMWDGAKAVWDKFTSILDTVGQKIDTFRNAIADAFNHIKEVVTGVWDSISGIIGSIGDAVGSAGSAVANALGLGSRGMGSTGDVDGGAAASAAGFASGGQIFGPGSGTSDSILGMPAMVRVSNGEYVVNSAATAKYLPLLNALNGGTVPGFAAGGYVSADQLTRFASGVEGKPYIWGGTNWGDCCLVPETMVWGPDGPKRIVDIRPGDRVFSHEDGKLTSNTVTAQWFSKRQEVFKVRTRRRSIVGSANHPFLTLTISESDIRRKGGHRPWHELAAIMGEKGWTYKQLSEAAGVGRPDLSAALNGKRSVSRNMVDRVSAALGVPTDALDDGTLTTQPAQPARYGVQWKRLDELNSGDLLLQPKDSSVDYVSNTLPSGRPIGLNEAWLLGLIIGDGSVSDTQVEVCVYGETRRRATEVFNGLGIHVGHSQSHGMRANSTQLGRELTEAGFRKRAHDKSIPDCVWGWDADRQRAFLNGYCDADGHHPADVNRHGERTYASASRHLIDDVR